ncbi:p-type h+-atpase isoform C [Micractinium conductrix]|uniref:Plasma membrane ATPase n=1 Tax=Micractinium conductrix TaxID=554055 RepID=A0A2P6VG07_9CHLO|nr:p-type h+-atpase isoform A [Micractinium conductrix]PSC73001.1 p-type h+-atpase isoform B [Micractinium conductrix]PSC73002.1 p-type h+-atpase isoform C [Micractinium conductrix]|eukprot:PSC73000.1 p-type h+-atpase isoform A [Micractinium conductrix]
MGAPQERRTAEQRAILEHAATKGSTWLKRILDVENHTDQELAWSLTDSPLKPFWVAQAQAIMFYRVTKTAALLGRATGHGFLVTRLPTAHPTLIKFSAPLFLDIKLTSVGLSAGRSSTYSFVACMGKQLQQRLSAGHSYPIRGLDAGASCGSSLQERSDFLSLNCAGGLVDTVGVSTTRGAILDVSFAGGRLAADEAKNRAVYGDKVTPLEILCGTVDPPAEMQPIYSELSLIVHQTEREKPSAAPSRTNGSLERYSTGMDPDKALVLEDGRLFEGPPLRRHSPYLAMGDPEANGAAEVKPKKEDSHTERREHFVESQGLTSAEAEKLLAEWGKNELQEKSTPKWLVYLKHLWGPMPIMIWIAIIVEFAIQNWIDAGILLGIQFANATLGWYETTKAADAVAALKKALKPLATCKRDGKWANMDATMLVPGDLVLLGAGAAVPADCIVNEGRIEVDQAALTGESLPVTMYKGDTPKMGSTITRGEVEGTVEFTGANTFFGKTASMLQGDDGLGNLQKILLKIMFVLVALSLTLCFIALMYLLFKKNQSFKEALSFTIVLLVASIPIAIEIVCTTTLALGSRQLSAYGAIVTRLQSIEEMAGMNMLCSDKTGTLTLNKMEIQDYCPVFKEGEDLSTVLIAGALAAKWQEPAKDALDTMVLGAVDLPGLDKYTLIDHSPFDPTIKRTEGHLRAPDGSEFKTTKGAPQIIAKLCGAEDNPEMKMRVEAEVANLGSRGIRSLAVARTKPGNLEEWELLGMLTFLDPPRPDTKQTIEQALENGVDVKMITGDQVLIAKEMSRILGLRTNIPDASGLPKLDEDGKIPKDLAKYAQMIVEADGFAQVYPEHKYLIVECLRQVGFAVGMTGDGVNDAPALKKADVGIAVAGATDAARAAADIVLTDPGLGVVIHAIIIARQIFQRVKNFINYRIAATLQLLVFFFISVFIFDPYVFCENSEANGFPGRCPKKEDWPEFFQLPVLMLMIITLLNDGTLISIGYDNVKSSPRPEKWNLRVLFLISTVLGMISMGSSLLLVHLVLDSPNSGSLFQKWGLPVPYYGKLVTMIYLKVSLSDFLTLFSARTEGPFWSMRPGKLLMSAATVALSLSIVLACVWPEGELDHVPVEGLALKGGDNYTLWPLWVWLYCIFFWFIQDACKVLAYYLILKFDVFQARTGGLVNLRDAFTANHSKITEEVTGMVETKLLDKKVAAVEEQVTNIAKKELHGALPPQLARISKTTALARTSMTGANLGRTSATAIAQQVAEIEAALAQPLGGKISAEERQELERRAQAMREAAARLQRVSAVRGDQASGSAPPRLDTTLLAARQWGSQGAPASRTSLSLVPAALYHKRNPYDFRLRRQEDEELPGVSNLEQSIDEMDEQRKRSAQDVEEAKAAALKMLGARPHSRKELKSKLLERGHELHDVRDALDRLAKVGLQSDEEFAEVFARSKWRQSKWGPRRIEMELHHRGVSAELSAAALHSVFGEGLDLRQHLEQLEDEEEGQRHRFAGGAGPEQQLLEDARNKWDCMASLAEEARRRRFVAWLQRRGHQWDDIRTLMHQLEKEDAQHVIDDETASQQHQHQGPDITREEEQEQATGARRALLALPTTLAGCIRQLTTTQTTLTTTQTKLRTTTTKLSTTQTSLTACNSKLGTTQTSLTSCNAARRSLNTLLTEEKASVQRLGGQLVQCTRNASSTDAQYRLALANSTDCKGQLDVSQALLTSCRATSASRLQKMNSLSAQLNATQLELNGTLVQLVESRAQIEALRQQASQLATCFDGLLDCKAELAALKQDDCATQLAAEQAAAEGWRAQYQEAGRNLTSCREESSALEAHLVEVGAANDTASAERAACLDSLDACEEDYSSLLLSCA